MQQPDDSIPVPAVTPPATIDPDQWERYQGFRECFLVHFPGAEENAAFRTIADLIYDLILETPTLQPDQPEGVVRSQLRAAVADIRFLEGYLDTLAREGSVQTPHEEHLCRFAGKRIGVLKRVADEFEEQLGDWRGEAGA